MPGRRRRATHDDVDRLTRRIVGLKSMLLSTIVALEADPPLAELSRRQLIANARDMHNPLPKECPECFSAALTAVSKDTYAAGDPEWRCDACGHVWKTPAL